jgi:chorismate mutase
MSDDRPIRCRGVRGATTVEHNTRDEVLKGTQQLLALMIRQNSIEHEDVASAIFMTTPDLNAEFPALAARQWGWLDVPLLCTHEINVPGSLARCVRILIHWNTTKTLDEIHHVYIRDAARLRPDLCRLPPVDWDELEAWIEAELAVQEKLRARKQTQ